MIIDFNNIQESVMPLFKGGEGDTRSRIFFDGLNKIMLGRLDVGCSIGYHLHETNSEIIYIISGEARCLTDEGEERLSAGMSQYCPKGHGHGLANASTSQPLVFFAVVTAQ